MNPENRQKKIKSYGKAHQQLVTALKNFPPEMWNFRPAKNRWTIHEIIIHITDSEANSYIRCRRFLAEPGGTIFGYDEEKWAVELYYQDQSTDEGVRFPVCLEGKLEALVKNTGLNQVEARPIDVTTVFQNFEDYWKSFLGFVGPAPGYTMSLSPSDRLQLENKLRERLPIEENGSISLTARAWAVKGTVN